MELTIAYYERWLNDDQSVASLRNESYMLRDFEEKEFPYFKSDVPEMLDKLLEKGLIRLTESKLKKLEELMIPNITSITGSSVII